MGIKASTTSLAHVMPANYHSTYFGLVPRIGNKIFGAVI